MYGGMPPQGGAPGYYWNRIADRYDIIADDNINKI